MISNKFTNAHLYKQSCWLRGWRFRMRFQLSIRVKIIHKTWKWNNQVGGGVRVRSRCSRCCTRIKLSLLMPSTNSNRLFQLQLNKHHHLRTFTRFYTLPGAFPVQQQSMNTGLQFANNGQYAQSSFMPVNSAHSNFQSHPSVLTFPG